MAIQLFISAVTDEFGSYRDELRRQLQSLNVTVHTQESFVATGTKTLDKLDEYIRESAAVVHLIGDMTGALVHSTTLNSIRARYPDLPHHLPCVKASIETNRPALSLTQWEAYLALYHGKRLFIAVPEPPAPRDRKYRADARLKDAQQAHLERLESLGHYAEIKFDDVHRLVIEVLRALIHILPPQAAGRLRPISLPYPSLGALFKGRGPFLSELNDGLCRVTQANPAAVAARAVHGLVGVGKTRVAVEYAWSYQSRYSALLLVNAATADKLRADLAALTRPLRLLEDCSTDDEVRLRAVLDWLNRHPTWLLILDSLDTPDMLEEARRLMSETTGGHVLITSQLANFPGHIVPLELNVLDEDAATDFLLERTKDHRGAAAQATSRVREPERGKARELAHEIGRLALALEHAGAFVVEKRLSFAQYLEHWRANKRGLISWSNPYVTQYPHGSVAVTVKTAVGRLSEEARRMLGRLSWLSPAPIPNFLLDVAIPGTDHGPFAEAFSDLAALSLVMRHPESLCFSVHRLVQDVTRSFTGEDTRQSLAEALRWIDAAFTDDPSDVKSWARLDLLAPHALAVAGHAQSEWMHGTAVRLTNAIGLLFTTKASHAQREIELGFSPRGWLPAMTKLKVEHTKFKRALEPLEGLTNLQELSLRATFAGDAAPLARWVNLHRLDLGRTEVMSIAPLAKLKELRSLDLWRTKVRDLSPLAGLEHLESLSLAHTEITDVSPLAELQGLRHLDLSDTAISNVSCLAKLSNLTHLRLGGTLVSDISVLESLTHLESLDLSDTTVTDLGVLGGLTDLHDLRLNGTRIRDIHPLAGLDLLKLDLGGTKVRNVSALSGLIHLEVLSLGGCAVEDLLPLAALTNLKVLNLGCTRLMDALPLSHLSQLRSLDVRGTRIRDVRPIAKLLNLESLDLAHTPVTEVSPLACLAQLEILRLDGTRVCDAHLLASSKRLKICRDA